MRNIFLLLCFTYLLSCTKNNKLDYTTPIKPIPPVQSLRCETIQPDGTYFGVYLNDLTSKTYIDTAKPYTRKYRFINDSTAVFTYLKSTNPTVYDSVTAKTKYFATGIISISASNEPYNLSFRVYCSTSIYNDTLFIAIGGTPTKTMVLKWEK